MHGSSQGTPVPLTTLGGLVSLASPDSLPEGASPRCYDNDYNVGSTKTRDGLTSVYTFNGADVGPNPGGSAVDTPTGGVGWINPGNVLVDDLAYATAALQTQLFVQPVPVPSSSTWTNPANATSPTLSTTYSGGALNTLLLAVSGLAIPSNAVISGVQMTCDALVASPGAASLSANFEIFGAAGVTAPINNTLTSYTFGSALYKWGLTLTPGMLNAGFQMGISSTATTNLVSLRNLKIQINYVLFPALSDGLDITQFGFSVPSTSTPQGFVVRVKGFGSIAAVTLNAQMLKAGVPVGEVRSVTLNIGSETEVQLGSTSDLFGSTWNYSDLNAVNFGVRLSCSSVALTNALLGYVTLTAFLAPTQSNFDFATSFTQQNGTVKNLLLDAAGNFWVEDVTNNPGVLTLAFENATPNSYCVGVNGPDVEYLAFNDGSQGSDMPRQYTPLWTDRITQVGPGASPVFTPIISTSDTFAISTITQNGPNSDPTDPGHISVLLWSAGPSSTAPGNTVTVFYAPSLGHPEYQDMVLVNQFNSGQPVYVYIVGAPFGNGTFLVTSVGNSQPPGVDHFRYYFTIQVPTSSYQNIVEAAGTYNITLATLTTSVPVPGLTVGNIVTITGSSVASYDAAWPISQTLNSASMAITNTQVAAGIATFNYALLSGTAPVTNQLVTITGTTNANGALNLVNATIASSTGGSTGTFTIAVSAPDAPSSTESGQATTAGTIFAFDPGLLTLGGLTSPIYGNATGGTLTFAGAAGQFVAEGTKQGVVFFETRNGYFSAPSPPVTFTIPANCTGIVASQIPVGPPNVIARHIAFTESGQNGVPGANFFTIQTPVEYIVQNVKYTATALVVDDNTSTSASFFFTDVVLLNAQAIDVYGFNLFNQIELGNPGWVVSYSSRNFYGLCQNKLQNFNNLSFDGGYLPGGVLQPLGWSTPDQYGSLLVSPVFGNSYYIQNSSGGDLAVAGLISQTAYQDAYQQPILNANTAYSVRVTARVPSGITVGNLVISLTANGVTFGSYTLPFASMTTNMAIYSGTLLVTEFPTVPTALVLNLSATAMGAGADVEIDRVDIFPTAIPVLGTVVFGSYAGLPEQVDGVTGRGEFVSENQQQVNGAVVMYDTFYALKGQGPNASMYSWQASPNLEPSDWSEPEVAQRAGACGPMAFDFGEQWIVMACRNGVYLFEGGQPGKIMQEIFQIWDSLYWPAANKFWVKNDVTGRRLFLGVCMPTPNFWLPNAPVSAAPTSPNVMLMMNYQGLDSGEAIKGSSQLHTTMFGTLNAIDMRRKWSIWQIPSPYAAFVQTATDKALYICNGRENSKVYFLDPNATTDDGIPIDSLYTTFGFVDAQKAQQMPGLGMMNKRTGYLSLNASSPTSANLKVRFLPNQLIGPTDSTVGYNTWTVPGGLNLTPVCLYDLRCAVNFFATRTFVEWRGSDWSVSSLMLHMKADIWSGAWGPK